MQRQLFFLSATPLQMQSDDLFNQLSLLRPDLFQTKSFFENMSEPNPFINKAIAHIRSSHTNWHQQAFKEISNVLKTNWRASFIQDDPSYQDVVQTLQSGMELSAQEKMKLLEQVESLHTLSEFINRTRRKDISELITMREPVTVGIQMSKEAMNLFQQIALSYQEDILREYNTRTVGLLMPNFQRRLASCTTNFQTGYQEDLEQEDSLANLTKLKISLSNQTLTLIQNLHATGIDKEKYQQLQQVIQEKQTTSNPRLIIFTSFRHTIAFLAQQLQKSKWKFAEIHGGIDDEERQRLTAQFKKGKIAILLMSDVGCEGLDFQCADCIVNYDIPWNPATIIQRIGRIDRYGQQSEKIAIYNMIMQGTVDERVL